MNIISQILQVGQRNCMLTMHQSLSRNLLPPSRWWSWVFLCKCLQQPRPLRGPQGCHGRILLVVHFSRIERDAWLHWDFSHPIARPWIARTRAQDLGDRWGPTRLFSWCAVNEASHRWQHRCGNEYENTTMGTDLIVRILPQISTPCSWRRPSGCRE